MVVFTDDTIAEIAATIGARKPETGGALFGPDNSNVISFLAFDAAARTTDVTYTPSKELIAIIPEIEVSEKIVFKGIIHSHPGNLDRPSGPDLTAFARTLRENPQLKSLITPIVNFRMQGTNSNALPLTSAASMCVYEAFRPLDARAPAVIKTVNIGVMPVREHLASGTRPEEVNPCYHPDRINDRWPAEGRAGALDMEVFAQTLEHFAERLRRLARAPLHEIVEGMSELFGERVGAEVKAIITKRFDTRAATVPNLVQTATGNIKAPALVRAAQDVRPVPQHNFHPMRIRDECNDET